jgi:protein-L-isoaspartate(D-aspartate) O-methyltransferase
MAASAFVIALDSRFFMMVSRLSPIAPNQSGQGVTSQRARDRMIERLQAQGISDVRVLAAMAKVPRHLFVDEGLQTRAYEDTALPIGFGQTISQPWVVAKTVQLVLEHFDREGSRAQKVLEIGTGCGYQAAVLAHVAPEVFSVERIDELLRGARRRLRHMGLDAIRSNHADGQLGWPTLAPFDAAVVAAGGLALSPEFFAQIAPGGVVVAPVGDAKQQTLTVFRHSNSGWKQESVANVMFVPLLSGVR